MVDGDDGVVKYQSAHIEPVESELVIKSGHSTQATPATIEEVRRILYLHLDESLVHGAVTAGNLLSEGTVPRHVRNLMHLSLIDALGFAAGVLTTVSFIPQAGCIRGRRATSAASPGECTCCSRREWRCGCCTGSRSATGDCHHQRDHAGACRPGADAEVKAPGRPTLSCVAALQTCAKAILPEDAAVVEIAVSAARGARRRVQLDGLVTRDGQRDRRAEAGIG